MEDKPYQIVRGHEEHAPWLATLYKDHTFPGANGPLTYSADDFRRIARAANAQLTVAEADGIPIGCVLVFDMVVWGYVDLVVVHADWRGRGVLQDMMAAIRTHGWMAVELCHLTSEKRLGLMAQRLGFQACGDGWTWRHHEVTA